MCICGIFLQCNILYGRLVPSDVWGVSVVPLQMQRSACNVLQCKVYTSALQITRVACFIWLVIHRLTFFTSFNSFSLNVTMSLFVQWMSQCHFVFNECYNVTFCAMNATMSLSVQWMSQCANICIKPLCKHDNALNVSSPIFCRHYMWSKKNHVDKFCPTWQLLCGSKSLHITINFATHD